jgi:hypothetical protein
MMFNSLLSCIPKDALSSLKLDKMVCVEQNYTSVFVINSWGCFLMKKETCGYWNDKNRGKEKRMVEVAY